MIRQKLLVISLLMLLPLGVNAQGLWSKYLFGIYNVPGHDEIGFIPVCIDYEYDDVEQEGSANYNNYTCWVVGKYENYENLDEYGFPQFEPWTYSGDVYIPSTIEIQYDENNPDFIVSTPFYMNETYTITGIGSEAFLDCTGLTKVTIPNTVTTIGDYAFYGCSSLTRVTIYCTEPPAITSNTFSNKRNCRLYVPYGCKATYMAAPNWADFFDIVEMESTEVPTAYTHLSTDGTTLTFYYDSKRGTRQGTTFDLNEGRTLPDWYNDPNRENITNVVFDPSFANARPTSTYVWFGSFINLLEIEGMEYLNTEEVTIMEDMFSSCPNITNIDVSHFNTSKVTNMVAMFNGCQKLQSLDLSHFDTSKVTDMTYMFHMCWALTSLDVTNFDTSSVQSMNYLFADCQNLLSIDVTHFNTSNVTSMDCLFEQLYSIQSLDLSSFDTSNLNISY